MAPEPVVAEADAVPVAGHAAELAVAPVAELAAGLADGEHVVGLAAEFGVVDAAAAVPAVERDDVLDAVGLAAEQLDELVPVGAACCSSFLVE